MKKIVFTFIFSFLSLELAAKDFYRDESEYCVGRYITLELGFQVIQKIHNNTMEYFLCERMFPDHKNRKSIQSNKYGVPSEVQNYEVPELKEKLEFKSVFYNVFSMGIVDVSKYGYYPKFSNTGTGSRNYTSGYGANQIINMSSDYLVESNDWEGLLALNKEAAHVWKTILEKSDLYNDYDSLKNAYVFDKKLHSKRSMRGEISKLIFSYKQRVFEYLVSSGVRYTHGASLIKSFHPFFMQIIVELYSQLFINKNVDKRRMRNVNLELDNTILYFSLFNNESLLNEYKNERPEFDLALRKYEFRGALLSLVTMASADKNCFQLGLKPELSRAILFGVSDGLYTSAVYDVFRNIRESLVENCGNSFEIIGASRSAHSRLYNPNNKYFKNDILGPFRKKAVRFLKSIDWDGY